MTGTWVIAAQYFQRIARKPVLILFLFAIPFTLLLAEFAAFGRTSTPKRVEPLPVVLGMDGSAEARRFAQCLAEQPGHPLQIREGDAPLNEPSNATDAVLLASIGSICRSAAHPASVVIDRAAPSADTSAATFMAQFFPGLALFGALFLTQSMASLVWRDQEREVQRRLLAMPVRTVSLVLGPILFLSAGATIALTLILGFCALATKPGALSSPWFWEFTIGFALCAAGLQLGIGLMARTQRAAQAMSGSANMMLAVFGGGFVPLAVYPPLLRAAALALPNGAAQAGLSQTLGAADDPHALLARVFTVWIWAAVLVFGAVALQTRRLRT